MGSLVTAAGRIQWPPIHGPDTLTSTCTNLWCMCVDYPGSSTLRFGLPDASRAATGHVAGRDDDESAAAGRDDGGVVRGTHDVDRGLDLR